MDVIPFIMTEKEAGALTDDMLYAIAQCSTEGVLVKVRAYLESDKHNDEIAKRIEKAYEDPLKLRDYLKSPEVEAAVECIKDLTYDNISIGLSIEQLQKYQNAIQVIFGSKYSVPYISPIKKSMYDNAIDLLNRSSSGAVVAEHMRKSSVLFKDLPSAPSKGTVVKKIVRNRTQYEIISKGINVIISRKKSNMTPDEWRYL